MNAHPTYLRYLIKDSLKVYAYVILENHLHLVAQSNQLDRDIARIKSFTAKQLIQYLDQNKVTAILEQLAFYKKAHKGDRLSVLAGGYSTGVDSG